METDRFKHAGLDVVVGIEEYAEDADPRQWDNLGTMVCWHPDYALGDFQITNGDGRGAVQRDRHGSASTIFEPDHFRSMEILERYLRLARGAVVVLPLYLLDHSGLSISAGSNTVGRGDTAIPGGGRDSWGNPRGWDTTMVGFIYTTRERIEELCGEPRAATEPFYCPPDWTGTAQEWIVQQLRAEVAQYDAYLRGSVYWWAVEDEDGDVYESCGGYLVVDEDDERYLLSDAKAAAESERARLDAEAAERVRVLGEIETRHKYVTASMPIGWPRPVRPGTL